MDIRGVSLVLSCDCNLNCSYCHLSAHNLNNRKKAIELQKATVQALQDGTFIKNIRDVFEKLGQSTDNVEAIDFWGQETTLSLPEFTAHAEDWLKLFPNLKSIMFSTNGMTNSNIVYEYVKKMNSLVTPPFSLKIQYSYDGEWSTRSLRGADPDVIKNNLKTLLKRCVESDFNNVDFMFSIHGVFGKTLFNHLRGHEDLIYDYNEDMIKFGEECEQIIHGRKNMRVGVGVAGELPYDGGVEDGKEMAKLFKHFFESPKFRKVRFSPFLDLAHYYLQGGGPRYESHEKLPFILNEVVDNKKRRQNWQQGLYCGASYKNLKIIYDGTVLGCQNFMFDMDNYTDKKELTMSESIHNSLIDRHHHYNPLVDKKEQYETILGINEAMMNDYILYGVHHCASTMILLAEAGQINDIYLHDKQKLLCDAFFLASKNVCHYNYYIATGSYFIKDTGYLRLYCNGLLDTVREYVDEGGPYAHI